MVAIDAGIEGTVAYLAQEYAAGDSLDAAIRQHGPAPVSQAIRILAGVAGALNAAAAVGVHHGALHPRDLLVTADDLRLTGLGIAAALDAVGARAAMRRPYTAPERLQREEWDGRADVYSLGVLARELLAGRRRRETGTPGPPLADDPAARLDPVFARATAARPSDRFATAREFIDALDVAVASTSDALRAGVAAPAVAPAPRGVEDLRLPSTDAELADDMLLDVPGRPGPEDLGPTPESSQRTPAPVRDIDDLSIDDLNGKPDRSSDLDLTALNGSRQPRRSAEWPRFVDVPSDLTGDQPADVTFDSVPAALSRSARPAAMRRSLALPFILTLLAGLIVGGAAGCWFGLRQGAARAAAGPSAQAPAATAPPASSTPAPTTRSPVPAGQARPAAAPPSAADMGATGRLTIKSVPTGAAVTVNGRARGATPITLRSLEADTYLVRVSRRGFVTEEREVVLSPDQPSLSLTLSLVRGRAAKAESYTGSLSVRSQPPGARVFVDGRPAGTTPVVVPDVPAGSHAVRVDLIGFRRWAQAVQVVAGQRVRVTAALEREER